MAECPDNSSSCLLRVIADAQGGYNWSPLNFTFTALLSILALMVAVIAVIQGFLAAGPGRLKASKPALGPRYSLTAQTRFDWKEFRFRTVVEVPFIEMESIKSQPLVSSVSDRSGARHLDLDDASDVAVPATRRGERRLERVRRRRRAPEGDDEQNFADNENRSRFQSFMRDAFRYWRHTWKCCYPTWTVCRRPLTQTGDPLASWSLLLDDTGCQQGNFRPRMCRTDYLPADVQAAPAFATSEALIVLALLAGCTSYGVAQGQVYAKGPKLQLEPRSHPLLGLVVTYQRYVADTSQIPMDSRRAMQGCGEVLGEMTCSYGLLTAVICEPPDDVRIRHLSSAFIYRIDRSYMGCGHAECDLRNQMIPSWPIFFKNYNDYVLILITAFIFADSPPRALFWPSAALGEHRYLTKWLRHCQPWLGDMIDVVKEFKAVPKLGFGLLYIEESDDSSAVDVSTKHNALKPSHLIPDDEYDDRYRRGSLFEPEWVDDCLESKNKTWFDDGHLPEENPARPRSEGFPLFSETLIEGRRPARPTRIVPADEDLVVSRDALAACFEYINDVGKIQNLRDSKRENLRAWVTYQLAEVDWYLKHQGGQDAVCAALNLLVKQSEIRRDAIDDGGKRGDDAQRPQESAEEMANEMHLVAYRSQRRETDRSEDWGPRRAETNVSKVSRLDPEGSSVEIPEAQQDSQGLHFSVDGQAEDEAVSQNLLRSSIKSDPITRAADGVKADSPERYMGAEAGTGHLKIPPPRPKAESYRSSLDSNQDEKTADSEKASQAGKEADDSSSDAAAGPDLSRQPSVGADPNEGAGRAKADHEEDENPADPSRGARLIKSERRIKAMETLIVYRALLYATLLATTIDTSNLLMCPWRDQVLQVL